jgi:hypothetical protein
MKNVAEAGPRMKTRTAAPLPAWYGKDGTTNDSVSSETSQAIATDTTALAPDTTTSQRLLMRLSFR